MKRNFSQKFITDRKACTSILVQLSDGSYLLSTKDEEAGLYVETFQTPIDESGDIPLQLVKFLYTYNLSLVTYRKLDEEVVLSYSFINNDRGMANKTACYHAVVDKTADFADESFSRFTLEDVVRNYQNSIFFPSDVARSLAQLVNEARIKQ